MKTALAIAVAMLLPLGAAPASAQQSGPRTDRPPLAWDLALGTHARELPVQPFIDFACGTRGGPPALALSGFADYARCRAERDTRLYEVHIRYDDEPEYWARARHLVDQLPIYQYNVAYDIAVITSLLFDADGFYVGYRLASDTRIDTVSRENGSSLAGFMKARYGEENFACDDLPPAPGEAEFQGVFIKETCNGTTADGTARMFVEARHLRKPGQRAIDQYNGPTTGLFESTTFFELRMDGDIPDRAARLAALPPPAPTERDLLIERVRSCPGCNLQGISLKGADLSGANLAGAILNDANLHGANLAGADLTGAQLVNANLNRVNLRQAKLAGALLAGSMLYGSKLDGANLAGANLNGVLAGAIQLGLADLSNSFLKQSDFRAARINDANLAGADLSGSLIDDAQMTRANLTGANLSGVSLWRAGMVEANLSDAILVGADLYAANLREANLTGADFSNARMTSAIVRGAKVDGASFAGATLPAGFTPPG